MATKKPQRPALKVNGEPAPKHASPLEAAREIKAAEKPVVKPARQEPRPVRMTKAQLEQQVHSLEAQVVRLNAELEEIRGPQIPWWEKISGSFANDPDFKEAMRLGREWRESFRPKKRTRKVKSSDGRS